MTAPVCVLELGGVVVLSVYARRDGAEIALSSAAGTPAVHFGTTLCGLPTVNVAAFLDRARLLELVGVLEVLAYPPAGRAP